MHTGDLATMDAEGYVNIVGRIKDMVIRGGENVYPREIEEFLYRHPAISDVQVIGVPDRKYGEELCAWVVLKAGQTATADEIHAFCRDLTLPVLIWSSVEYFVAPGSWPECCQLPALGEAKGFCALVVVDSAAATTSPSAMQRAMIPLRNPPSRRIA